MESLKLIIEKGPREGETLTYSSDSLIKVGRVIKGNTIAIKESGISSKHMCIQFDNQLKKWIVYDLNSSNGTFLNTHKLQPHVPSAINDGDRIKIGELTSIFVSIEVQSSIAPVGQEEKSELGLGFDGDLGKIEVKQPVKKRNLRSNAKKDVGLKNEVETRRTLRSSKKDELNQIPETLNVDVSESVDVSVPEEPKKTRGRKKNMLPVNPDLDQTKPADVAVVPARMTRGRRKALPVEPLEDKLNNVTKSLQADEGNEAALGENLESNNEPVQEQLEKVVSTQEGSSKGKEEDMKYGCYNDKWNDLEKMTVGDFFDYLEWQLAKEIYDKSEKIIADMTEKARKYHEFRRQINEPGKGIN